MAQSLKKRAAELESRIEERAEEVKRVLRDYREAVRAGAVKSTARILKKRRDVERANAEYMELQKELDLLLRRMESRKQGRKSALMN
ncbi:MAG: hypothetical protein L0229_11525 [Blastocatellia bacterium]|nr:hypothetical protein [Blastocatellia bacterium]